ncbi:MAG: amidohydrolase family protein [Planctomycetota bacterium]
MWRDVTRSADHRRIFRDEFDGWLPDRLCDMHVHVFNRAACGVRSYDCAGHKLAQYDLADLATDLAAVLPGRRVTALCFGLPIPARDWRAGNRYLGGRLPAGRHALRLLNPAADTPAVVEQELDAGRYLGFKPYPDFVTGRDPKRITVAAMLPGWAMEIAAARQLIVTLHIPRPGRLADPVNLAGLERLARDHRGARIVVAHIGRAHFLKCIAGNIERLLKHPNLFFDLAMLNSADVLEYAFRVIPAERILYGSDIPIALAPGKSVEINDQYSYVTPVPWELSIADTGRRIRFTSFLYEELRAVRTAMRRRRLGDRFAERIFYENGMGLIQTAQKGSQR